MASITKKIKSLMGSKQRTAVNKTEQIIEKKELKTEPVTGTVRISNESIVHTGGSLSAKRLYELLVKIDNDYSATYDEERLLRSITYVVWTNIPRLPNSIGMMESLKALNICDTKVEDLRALSSLTSLVDLYLHNTDISDISALSELTNLKRLDLNSTKISNIEVLSNLKTLTHLNLSGTEINDISALSELTNLKRLDLNSTMICDIEALSNLKMLTHLNLSGTQINEINTLAELTNLIELDLSSTKISDIRVLSNLVKLQNLSLKRTIIKNTSRLSNLNELRKIDLEEAEVDYLDFLSGLASLKVLNLQNSSIVAIPESILDLKIDFITYENDENNWQFNTGIYIYGLTLKDQPIEIFSQRRELIRAYYREGKQVPVNECKVIFLGDAESGKTHSIKRLLNNGEILKDFDGESTPGIEITVSPNKLLDTDIVVNYWDFGGQEIQHSMHRMFLTERTVYVVFLNARQDDQMDERARYWLENIKAFAPRAPVIVVINKIDQNEHPRFNERGILETYGSQVKKVVRMSAKRDKQNEFLDKLQGNINRIIMELPTVRKRIPSSWKKLMENIRGMKNHYLTTEQFMEKCKSNKIKNYQEIHDELVDLFQVIGVSFCYYKDRSLADYMLLNPKWMLNALYTIVTNGKAVAKNGVITQKNLYDLLQKDTIKGVKIRRVIPELRYKGFEINYILGVIRMFGLSYCMKDGSEFFPMLCDGDEKISVKETVSEDALHFIFRYKYLPTNIIHRLIVELQRDLDYRYVWYTGAVFRNKKQNQSAYINSMGNDLHIYVFGEDKYYNPNEYMTPISNKIRDINKDLGLSAVELLTCSKNGVVAVIPLKEVMGNLRNGVTEIYNATFDEMIKLDVLSHRYFDNRPKTDEFLESIVSALRAMQINWINIKNDENSRNKYVSDILNALLKGTGYTCPDQKTGGVGATGKAPGERDIVVTDGVGQEILIYEGMNLSGLNTAYIEKHIKKVLVNYNPQGLRYSVLVTYLECERDQFKSFSDKYREHIEEYAPESYSCVGKAKEVPVEGAFLDCMKMDYEVGGSRLTIFHIIVRIGA